VAFTGGQPRSLDLPAHPERSRPSSTIREPGLSWRLLTAQWKGILMLSALCGRDEEEGTTAGMTMITCTAWIERLARPTRDKPPRITL
jgi:hypothetical protein